MSSLLSYTYENYNDIFKINEYNEYQECYICLEEIPLNILNDEKSNIFLCKNNHIVYLKCLYKCDKNCCLICSEKI